MTQTTTTPSSSSSTFQIHYFASASSFTQKHTESLPAPLPLHKLFDLLESRYPGIREKVLDSCAVSVGLEYVDVKDLEENGEEEEGGKMVMIGVGEEVAIIPPKNDGAMVAAMEEDLYRYTTKRWLSNDALEASKRYQKFNIQRLLDVAVNCTGAKRCTSAMKYREGQYNKYFLITFDNGSEVVAKLPNPNAGPKFFTAASEVATMDYVSNEYARPEIPGLILEGSGNFRPTYSGVLSWSCGSSNPVESEYIIMEKAKGTALGDTWYRPPSPSKHRFIEQVAEMEEKLTAAPFPEHGCIYYTQDLPMDYRIKDQPSLPGDHLKKFASAQLYTQSSGPRSTPGLDSLEALVRHQLCDYAESMGINERAWAMQHAQPHMNYYRSNVDRERPDEYLDLIEKYLLVAPHLAQSKPDTADLIKPMLWHGAIVAPLILQAKIPRMVQHPSALPFGWVMPEKPEDYDTLPEIARSRADKLYENALCHRYYEVITAKRNPRHYAAISHNATWKTPLIQPIRAVTAAWSSRESGVDCPISFTEEEKKLHDEEMENRDYVETMMEEFQEADILPIDGTTDPEDYEIMQKTNYIQKEKLLSLAENEEQREWMDKIWP
ncbi:hypothetical protein AJ80_05860 [Polytolypa hystricis UAMH7299]|uniref:Molybdopterin synthase sulfur carrier subunit n=1 Tax=Polytolypa hystricis (strain UAMH7299) TaxID=1447883 RepID=A0A2B7XZT8_POLH7|nr:hypothetical protein AJ80_05860 [Polytolypa hystricis UAMH7299]